MNKDWILTIGIDKFYLTQKQVEFYLKAIDAGAKYVAVEETKMIGTNFQSLVHESVLEETKALSEGKWKCEKGKWHAKGVKECFCEAEYNQLPNGSMEVIK